MTNEPSPRPWTFCPTYGEHRPNSIIVDADGGNVALVCHFANEEEENRIGNLIVDAVNNAPMFDILRSDYQDLMKDVDRLKEERDRLRDLLWRLTEYADAVTAYHPPTIWVVSSGHPARTFDGAALLREARAAIGEDNIHV